MYTGRAGRQLCTDAEDATSEVGCQIWTCRDVAHLAVSDTHLYSVTPFACHGFTNQFNPLLMQQILRRIQSFSITSDVVHQLRYARYFSTLARPPNMPV
jgi:hypothetical protein